MKNVLGYFIVDKYFFLLGKVILDKRIYVFGGKVNFLNII